MCLDIVLERLGVILVSYFCNQVMREQLLVRLTK